MAVPKQVDCAKNKLADRQSQINEQMERQHKMIERLKGLVDAIQDSLSPILLNEPPLDPTADDQPTLVPLAHGLRAHNESLSFACIQLESMLQRIEV